MSGLLLFLAATGAACIGVVVLTALAWGLVVLSLDDKAPEAAARRRAEGLLDPGFRSMHDTFSRPHGR